MTAAETSFLFLRICNSRKREREKGVANVTLVTVKKGTMSHNKHLAIKALYRDVTL